MTRRRHFAPSLRALTMALALAACWPTAADTRAGIRAAKARDYVTAFEEFSASAEAGDARAQALLANMYRRGLGTKRDMNRAVHWYRQAADQDDAMGQYNLGVAYRDGIGDIAADDAAAMVWFEKAARQGLAQAQVNVGLRYAQGNGVAKDLVTGYAWISKAAGSGFRPALDKLRLLEKRMSREQIRAARLKAARM